MTEVLYQGRTYDAYPIVDPNSSQVTGYQLVGYQGYPYGFVVPASQVTVTQAGTGTGGIVRSPNPPSSPNSGQVWQNTGTSTTAGVPANGYGVWNGSGWISVGTTPPNGGNIITSPTAPSPTPGMVWYNSSSTAVAGVPPNSYAVWNGSTWVPIGGAPPSTGSAGSAGVSSLNALTGAITLTEGSGIDITQSGNTLTIVATGTGAGTPGVSSLNALTGGITIQGAGGNTVTTNGQNIVITAPASVGGVSSFNTRSGAVTPQNGDYTAAQVGADPTGTAAAAIAAHTSAADPHTQYQTAIESFGSDYVAAAVAPTGTLTLGQIWRNTASSTVSGIPAGNYGVWSGSSWFDAGPRFPWLSKPQADALYAGSAPGTANANTVYAGPVSGVAAAPVFRALTAADVPNTAQNPGFSAVVGAGGVSAPSSVFGFVNPGAEVVDVLDAYNPATGLFTIPANFGGIWQFSITWIHTGTTSASQVYGYVTKNSTSPSSTDTFGGSDFCTNASRLLQCSAGDVIRFYAQVPTGGGNQTINQGSQTSGYLIFKQ